MSDARVEAFELARFAEQLAVRLGEAQSQLPAGDDYRNERQWLETAELMLLEEVDPLRPVLSRARLLPELSFLRDEVADEFLNAWVDGLEKLLAGITFHAGARAPVIEALFPPKTKLPNLRRATRETAEAFSNELERRLKGTYVTRIFGQEDMQFVQPVVEGVRKAFAEYLAIFDGPALPDEEAWNLRERLGNAGRRIELLASQAKLLAEAALLPIEGAYEAAGLNLKPKKRATSKATLTPDAEAQESESPREADAEVHLEEERDVAPGSKRPSVLEDAVASLAAHAAGRTADAQRNAEEVTSASDAAEAEADSEAATFADGEVRAGLEPDVSLSKADGRVKKVRAKAKAQPVPPPPEAEV